MSVVTAPMTSCLRPVFSTAALKLGSVQALTMPLRLTRAAYSSGKRSASSLKIGCWNAVSTLVVRMMGIPSALAALATASTSRFTSSMSRVLIICITPT